MGIPETIHGMIADGAPVKTRTLNVMGRTFGVEIAEIVKACGCEILDLRNSGGKTLENLELVIACYDLTLARCRIRDDCHEKLVDGVWTPTG